MSDSHVVLLFHFPACLEDLPCLLLLVVYLVGRGQSSGDGRLREGAVVVLGACAAAAVSCLPALLALALLCVACCPGTRLQLRAAPPSFPAGWLAACCCDDDVMWCFCLCCGGGAVELRADREICSRQDPPTQ